jgi:fused signal recognition particle receptor
VPDTPIIYIVIAVVAAFILWFAFFRKKQELPEPEAPRKLPEKKEPAAAKPAEQAPPAKAPPAKAPPEKPAEKAPAEKPSAEKPVAEKPAEKPPAEKPSEKPPAKPIEAPAEQLAEKPPEEPAVAEKPAPAKPAPERPAAERPAERPAKPSARKQDVEGLRKGLTKVREKEGFFGRLKALLTGKKEIDPNIVEQIEEVLLTSDVGVKTTETLLGEIRAALSKKELADNDRVWDALRSEAAKILRIGGGGIQIRETPTVVMVVGVNGVGKTTTIGKLATQLKAEGKTVVLAAGDTFRAAAVQQLAVWGKRVGCEVVRGKDGANPGAVIFDAIQRAKDIGADVVLADTAGRLHTKANLMEELKKVSRTMTKAVEGAPHETLLVLDATNGQNAMQQAALFKEALPISGIVLTKLDGTAKGGVILGICAEHALPVRYVGIGERAEDLREFDPDEFVEAMLGRPSGAEDAAA